jgi:hypothetical protein
MMKRADEIVQEDEGPRLCWNATVARPIRPGSAPENRRVRVQALKAAVDNSTYKPLPAAIADSMLSALLPRLTDFRQEPM